MVQFSKKAINIGARLYCDFSNVYINELCAKEKLKLCVFSCHITLKVKVAQSCPTLYNPMDYIVHGIMEWVAFPFSRGSSQPRDQSGSPALQADSFPAEPQGKPKNTGVGSLSFFQHIVQIQESNRSLLHWRQILYQLSY